jgi:hypothetical protein
LNSGKNVLQIIKDHIEENQNQKRLQIAKLDRIFFDFQWKQARYSEHILDVWDFSCLKTFERRVYALKNEETIFQRMMLYRSQKNDFLLLINLISFEEEKFFRFKNHKGDSLKMFTWECLWSPDGNTFYLHSCYQNSHKRGGTYIRARGCWGYYELLDLEETRLFYERCKRREITIEPHIYNQQPSIWGFNRIASLQELALSKLFLKS